MLESILERFVTHRVIEKAAEAQFIAGAASAAIIAPPPSAIEPVAEEITTPTSEPASDPICATCRGVRHWKPKGNSSRWICASCEPPPTLSMIGEEIGVPRIVERWAVAAEAEVATRPAPMLFPRSGRDAYQLGRPMCSRCGCRLVIENWWSDGVVTLECFLGCGEV